MVAMDDWAVDDLYARVRQAAPYPKPPARLLRGGRLELSETWLFQDDGRFQLRTRAEAWQQ